VVSAGLTTKESKFGLSNPDLVKGVGYVLGWHLCYSVGTRLPVAVSEVDQVSRDDQLFTIGFVAYEGTKGRSSKPTKLEPAPRGSLSELLIRAGMNNGFIRFPATSSKGAFLRQPLVSRPLGYLLQRADWGQVFDAMVLTRKMTPSEVIETKP